MEDTDEHRLKLSRFNIHIGDENPIWFQVKLSKLAYIYSGYMKYLFECRINVTLFADRRKLDTECS